MDVAEFLRYSFYQGTIHVEHVKIQDLGARAKCAGLLLGKVAHVGFCLKQKSSLIVLVY